MAASREAVLAAAVRARAAPDQDQPLRQGEARLDHRRPAPHDLQVHLRREAGAQQGTARRPRPRPEHLRSPDRHRLAARRHLLHHRRLRRNACRQVRAGRSLHHRLGPAAEGSEEPGTQRVQHRPQHRHQRRPAALRRGSRPSAHAGLRRERQVPRHVDAAFTALARQPDHADGQSLHR
ncbi:hypothetical protein D3C83_05640 [compost metagenome]